MTARACLAGAVLVGLLAVACAPMAIDEGDARRVATDALKRLSTSPGETAFDVHVFSTRQETRGTRPGWAVEIEALAGPNDRDGTVRHLLLFIDGATGEVTVEGQGRRSAG